MPHGSPEGQAIKEAFITALQTKYGMQRVEVDFPAEIVKGGQNISVVSTASSRINGWVRFSRLILWGALTCSINTAGLLATSSPSTLLQTAAVSCLSTLRAGPTSRSGPPTRRKSCTISLFPSSRTIEAGSMMSSCRTTIRRVAIPCE